MKKILLSIFAFSGLMASAQIADLPVSSSIYSINMGDSAIITIDSSQLGFDYYLRDNSDNSIVEGPIAGTDSSLTFMTGILTSSTTYNVFVKDQNYLLSMQSNNDYIDFTTDERGIDKELTVAAWIKTSVSTGLRNIVFDYAGSGQDAGYVLRLDANGKAVIDGRDGTTNYKTSGPSTTDVTDDQWHYVVGTIDNINGGFWKIYVDGVLENVNNYGNGNSLITSTPMYIGSGFSTSNAYYGELRDVTLWNKVLTAAEVTANMSNCLTGSETNVVGHFLLNENDTTTYDYSITGINGVYKNGTPSYGNESTSCNDSLEFSQLVSVNLVGIDELNTKSLSIYPNPATSQLTIKDVASPIITISIVDITGKRVKMINDNFNTINVADLRSGIYFLQVQTEEGLINSKFIKE